MAVHVNVHTPHTPEKGIDSLQALNRVARRKRGLLVVEGYRANSQIGYLSDTRGYQNIIWHLAKSIMTSD